eukprot:Skav235902  [mRNA]  locus=scaffold256:114831:118935:+ [translate_table: standard]
MTDKLETRKKADTKKACKKHSSGANVSLMDRVVQNHREHIRTARAEVDHFLERNGFEPGEVNGRRHRSFMSTTSPLHEAVKQQKTDIVGALLQFGADADFRDFPMGRTAFEYAQCSKAAAKEELTMIFRRHTRVQTHMVVAVAVLQSIP